MVAASHIIQRLRIKATVWAHVLHRLVPFGELVVGTTPSSRDLLGNPHSKLFEIRIHDLFNTIPPYHLEIVAMDYQFAVEESLALLVAPSLLV